MTLLQPARQLILSVLRLTQRVVRLVLIPMGIEYKLCFSFSDAESVNAELRRSMFQKIDRGNAEFEFRVSENPGPMPNASAHVEQYGLYFCDNGGASWLLGVVIANLVSKFGPVTVADLE